MALGFFFHYPETNGTESDMLDVGPLRRRGGRRRAGRASPGSRSPSTRCRAPAGWPPAGTRASTRWSPSATSPPRRERLRLLTHLVVAPYRNPFLLAKAAATVDKLSGGRLILGLGAGYQKSEFHALGVDFEERNALFDEALDVLPLHWSGEPFSYAGPPLRRARRHRPAATGPGPDPDLDRRQLQAQPAPRAAKRAQGWMPMLGRRGAESPPRGPRRSSVSAARRDDRRGAEAAAAAGRRTASTSRASYQDPAHRHAAGDADRHREAFARARRRPASTCLVVSAKSQ